jgi:hypothetical protein
VPFEPLAAIVLENDTTLENVIGPPIVNEADVFTIAELSLAFGKVPEVIFVAIDENAVALVYAAEALLVISVATEFPVMLRVAALTDVAVIAEALTTVELAVKLPLTVNPFFTTKLLLAIPVPYP